MQIGEFLLHPVLYECCLQDLQKKMWKSACDGLYQSAFGVGVFPGRRFQFPARRLCASVFRQCQNKASLGAEGIKVVRRRTAATFRITIKAPSSGSEEK
jgi:hypothetical protein